ncbi:hypothetical protein ACEPPN_016517 [Leptodophora sp. 'Broadleaf-Isolate-01']
MPAERRPKATAIKRKGPYNDSEQPRKLQHESNTGSLEGSSATVCNGQELLSTSPENNEARYPPEQYSEYFACPFAKHCPSRYHHINNACTVPRGFKDIGKLNEHIKRIHSLQYGCLICKKRFQEAKKETIKEIKATHQNASGECTAREFTRSDPEWLTQEQEVRFLAWEEQGSKNGSGGDKWQRIYQSIFGDEEQLPSPFYDYLIPYYLLSADPAGISPDRKESKLALLHSEILAENEKQYDYGFEYVVYKGTDSGYHSRGTNPTKRSTSESRLAGEHDAALNQYSSQARIVVPTVSQNEHFNVPDSYPEYLEDQDQDLLLVEHDSVYFDDAMLLSGNAHQDGGLSETEGWEDTVDNFSCMGEGSIA